MKQLSELTQEQQFVYATKYNEVKRNFETTCVLLFLFGVFGIHKLYLNNTGRCILYFLLFLTGIFVVPAIVLIILLALDFYNLLTSRSELKECNGALSEEILKGF